MIPRGEVGLIFAQMGLTTGALDAELFSAIMLMVMVTTFIAPILLGRIVRPAAENLADQPGDGGIDDLVSGSSQHGERRAGADRRGTTTPSAPPK
jgi:hypothetical protein